VQAYSVLESRRLIESRPQSGFYVRAQGARSTRLPRADFSQPSIVRTNSRERMRDMLYDLVGARMTALGSSFVNPALFPLQSLNKALVAASRQKHYTSGETLVDVQLGLPALRRAIAQRYLELGYIVPMEEIVITCGAMESISLSLQAVAYPGDLILIDSPMFFSGIQLLKSLRLNVLEMPTDPQEGLDLGVLDKTLTKHKVAACLLMTNCQNPLGFTMPEAKKRELVQLLLRHNVPLVENDVYAELQFDLTKSRAAKAFDANGMVLHCGSFTKCLAPGFNIGWVATGRFREAIANLKFAMTLGTSMPPQAAIAHYLLHHAYDKHLRALRQTLQQRIAQMSCAILACFPTETRLSQPAGGFVLWVQLPEAADAFKLFELAATRDIGITPGPILSASGRYRNFIRLNCSHPWSDALDESIRWLGASVMQMCA